MKQQFLHRHDFLLNIQISYMNMMLIFMLTWLDTTSVQDLTMKTKDRFCPMLCLLKKDITVDSFLAKNI